MHHLLSPSVRTRAVLCWLAAFLGLWLTACSSVSLVSDYDAGIDRGVTELQKATETFFVKLARTGRGAGPLTKLEQDFLDETAVNLSSLLIRASAHPHNEITTAQLALLRDSLATLGPLLEQGVTPDQLEPVRHAFNTGTAAILKLELAKQRGGKPAAN